MRRTFYILKRNPHLTLIPWQISYKLWLYLHHKSTKWNIYWVDCSHLFGWGPMDGGWSWRGLSWDKRWELQWISYPQEIILWRWTFGANKINQRCPIYEVAICTGKCEHKSKTTDLFFLQIQIRWLCWSTWIPWGTWVSSKIFCKILTFFRWHRIRGGWNRERWYRIFNWESIVNVKYKL